jgi:hypothetical protein
VRLFLLTQPALMQIGWFSWAYDTIMPWKDALVERVRASTVWRVGRIVKAGAPGPGPLGEAVATLDRREHRKAA